MRPTANSWMKLGLSYLIQNKIK